MAAAKVAAGVARLQYHLARWFEAMEEVVAVAIVGRSAVVEGVVLAAADMVMARAALVGVMLAAADMVMAGAAMVGGGVVAEEVEWASRAEVGPSTLLGRR